MAFMQPDTQKRGILGNIGRGLQAFGAGVQGRGPEFVALQQQQAQQLSNERKAAAAEDIRRAKLLFDQGRIGDIASLAQQRIGLIQQLGGDPSDTAKIFELAQMGAQGDAQALEALGQELNSGYEAAVMSGFIQPPEPISPEGKVERDRRMGFIPEADKPEIIRGNDAVDLGFDPGTVLQKKADGTIEVLKSPKAGQSGKQYTTLSPEQVAEKGLAPGTVAQIDQDGKLDIVQAPKAAVDGKPITDIGKLNLALERGEITPNQYSSAMQKKVGLAAESAFKAGSIVEAKKLLPDLKKLLFDDKGDLQESNLIGFMGIRGPKRRQVDALVENIITSKLRGESGAVITEDEIAAAKRAFIPSVWDDDETAMIKINNLESAINAQVSALLGAQGGESSSESTVDDLLKKYGAQ